MAGESYSPNMSLIIPGVGSTFGPDWASDLNASLLLIDSHDHTAGNGVQITPSGLDINSDLSMQANNLTSVRSVRMQAQGSPLALASDLGCIYVSGDDLYYNDTLGNQVRITASGAVAGTPGSIASLVAPASATYVGGSSKFVWQSNVNVAADMDAGAIILRNLTVSSFGLTLQPPSLSSDYAITLPTLPVSQKIMTLDASGNMAAPYVVDNSTIEIATNTIQVKDAGITGAKLNSNVVDNSTLQYTSNQLSIKNQGVNTTQLANLAVGTNQLGNLAVTTGKIDDGAVTPVKIAPNFLQSNSSGAFSNSSGVLTAVTNLSVGITTSGKVVTIQLQPDGSGSLSNINVSGTNGTVYLYRDSTEIANWDLSAAVKYPVSSFSFVEAPAAGTYTYTARVVSDGISVNYCRLLAKEGF